MSGKLLSAAAFLLLTASAAFADTTVTVTSNGVACQVPPPAEVAAPVTPSIAAGTQAARNGNFALARANFKPLADSGNVQAQRAMGSLLQQDCTGLQDKEGGAVWLSKAADAGDTAAQSQLGNDYMTARGVPQDDGKAFVLLSKAAANGDMQAEANLGYLYSSGRGVTLDLHQAMVWSVKAGEQGAPAALMNIALAYQKGDVLPQNSDKAALYMYAALERANIVQRTKMAGNVNFISRQMSATDLKSASERAQRWSPGRGSLSEVLDDVQHSHPGG